ncbi:conserved hypothetical protein [Methylobacterium sp. 4-46]|uniref:ABC transporter substrate-binding protein n=1 Tax=unclassified Methylobacterium TaxID=2615210 RepID=UPI000152DB23|nr:MULTISPECIES: ABC transporter substrate-binding protein [Methylobacterium]ACA19615.1 conserved hypothetical protein [Methylobacterium sp. 4-46]WFT78809.1 ABC transporter substrate-binding protein [Methylobacterium nodulans]
MDRRRFLSGLGLALVRPRGAAAQPAPLPALGLLCSESPELWTSRVDAFRAGLAEAGYVEGRDVRFSYRWARGRNDRLDGMAEDLVREGVAVIVVLGNTTSALAAKRATERIPIVVRMAVDPASIGLVQSTSRPGGNLTGWTTLGAQIGPKQLELLRELIPPGVVVAVLVNPTNPILADRQAREVPEAARALGFEPLVVTASGDADIAAAFARLSGAGARGLILGADTFFNSRNDLIAAQARDAAVAAISAYREFALAGGLMSYGGSVAEASRRVGAYVGRILGGEQPGDLPVQQIKKLDLVLNLRTAQHLAIKIPLPVLARADEILE